MTTTPRTVEQMREARLRLRVEEQMAEEASAALGYPAEPSLIRWVIQEYVPRLTKELREDGARRATVVSGSLR
jgi:hypothetical protein